MCESNVYVRRGDKEELLAEDVARVLPEGEEVRVVTLLGDEHRVRGTIRLVDLMAHKITIDEKG